MTPSIVIDARPRGHRGSLLASERVLGRPILLHLLDLAAGSINKGEPVAVHAREDDHDRLKTLAETAPVRLATGPPPEGTTILRSDRIYDPHRLRRALERGRDPESAVLWRLDRPWSLDAAQEELARRHTYQPLGRFWALAPARALARALTPTRIRPNMVTLAAAALFFGASAVIGFGENTVAAHLGTALALALALILDTADGHLARLQGTASEFGRWLDAVLDEAADLTLHLAVAWSLYVQYGDPGWLLMGSGYVVGKYLFVTAQTSSPAPDDRLRPARRSVPSFSRDQNRATRWPRRYSLAFVDHSGGSGTVGRSSDGLYSLFSAASLVDRGK